MKEGKRKEGKKEGERKEERKERRKKAHANAPKTSFAFLDAARRA